MKLTWRNKLGSGRRETDYEFMVRRYQELNGRTPCLTQPTLFSEKIVNRILYDHNPLYRTFCDKSACRSWIKSKLGVGFTPTTLAVAASCSELAATNLPPRWFLKANHGSGWFRYIDTSIQPFEEEASSEAMDWLSSDYFNVNREWAYKGLARKLIAEEVIHGPSGDAPVEAQFYFFSGELGMCRLLRHNKSRLRAKLRSTSEIQVDTCYISRDYQPLPIRKPHSNYNYTETLLAQVQDDLPAFEYLASRLTQDLSFLRVDGIITSSGIRFNELTPYPGAGFGYGFPLEWDAWLGSFWKS